MASILTSAMETAQTARALRVTAELIARHRQKAEAMRQEAITAAFARLWRAIRRLWGRPEPAIGSRHRVVAG